MLKKNKISVAHRNIFIIFAALNTERGLKLSDGVIGNTSGFGPEEFRFET